MASSLVVLPFTAELAGLVEAFACGEEPHERELADWIKQDALAAMNRGTSVWLFFTPERELVGYGSLGKTQWSWPDSASNKVPIQIIPAVAIQKHFWGKPEGPREDRYSSRILDHLVAEATERSDVSPLLGLFVHPANQRAVKLYQRAGFEPFHHTFTDRTTGIVYRSMIYELRPKPSAE
jgi:GNAT superfamily N-acetyltransferase